MADCQLYDPSGFYLFHRGLPCRFKKDSLRKALRNKTSHKTLRKHISAMSSNLAMPVSLRQPQEATHLRTLAFYSRVSLMSAWLT